jgi:UDP-N-acetyl-D-mannosaminuronate dehydrogenase
MNVGFVGLGKLGMPVALAMSMRDHDVMGYDVDPSKMQKESFPHREIGPSGAAPAHEHASLRVAG